MQGHGHGGSQGGVPPVPGQWGAAHVPPHPGVQWQAHYPPPAAPAVAPGAAQPHAAQPHAAQPHVAQPHVAQPHAVQQQAAYAQAGYGTAPHLACRLPADPMGQFRHSAIYEWRGDPQTINHHIAHIRQLDIQVEQEIETLRKSGSKRTIWGVVLGLVGLILGVLVVPLILLFIGIPLFISGMMRSAEANKRNALDYDNKRYELVRRLLEVVGRELEWSEPVHLYMDLRPAELPQKVRGAYKLFDNFMGGMTQTNYQDDWLWLQGQLVDGTQFTATMAERARVRAGYKRGASGKLKHKTKRKSKHYLGLQLKVRPKKYPGVFGIAQRGHPAVQLPPYCQPKSLKTKRNTVRLMAVLPHPWQEPAPGAMLDHRPRGSTVFAMMFLSLYQMLNLAKEKQRAAARRAGAGA